MKECNDQLSNTKDPETPQRTTERVIKELFSWSKHLHNIKTSQDYSQQGIYVSVL